MAKKRKSVAPPISQASFFKYLELQLAVIQHALSLKQVTESLAKGKTDQAIARLDQAVAALHATVGGQAVGITMPCPACGSQQDAAAWTGKHECGECGHTLVWPEEKSE